MRQQQTFRGFIFILLMLILIATAVRLPYARQADKVTNQDFIQILDDGQASEVAIHQNPQTPTGEVVITMADGQVKRLYVTDVKDTQKILDDHKMEYVVMDVPQENYLVTIILPFMLSIVVVVIIIMVMNRSAGGGGANARMMNFGKSRARMSRDSKVNFPMWPDLWRKRKSWRRLWISSRIPRNTPAWEPGYPRDSCLWDLREQVRRCWQRQWPEKQVFPSFPYQVLILWKCL